MVLPMTLPMAMAKVLAPVLALALVLPLPLTLRSAARLFATYIKQSHHAVATMLWDLQCYPPKFL
jgi:hypothetical protein